MKNQLENSVIFPKGEVNPFGQFFSGTSYLAMLSTEGVGIANVTFEPGCRNNWHVHHASEGGGQILLCTGGDGWYQEWGKPARALHAGDVVNIPPEVKHWHGAAKDSWFVHIAVEVPGKENSNEWLEPVSDEDYDKLSAEG
ncbi:MAG: cupin domain-containing protein [Eubacteriales bacterium]|nr:cupin domain-containing protein [Eubacteriales bacterium]